MAHRDMLGRINCPYCGEKDGMKITEDKSGNPFGNCDVSCHGQLRVGDKHSYRVSKFYSNYPHIRKCGAPVTVTEESAPVTVTGEKAPVTLTAAQKEMIQGAAASIKAKPSSGAAISVPAKRSFADDLALLLGGAAK